MVVEVIRRNPDKYTYGTDGVGAMVQLAGERLSSRWASSCVPYHSAAQPTRCASYVPRDRFMILEEAFRKAANGDGLKA